MQNDKYLLQLLFNSVGAKTLDVSSLIHLSCVHGKDDSLDYILDQYHHTVNLNVTMADGMTALMLACRFGHTACVHLLLHRKANAKEINPVDGKTSLHYAAMYGRSDCILALLQDLQANGDDLRAFVELRDAKGK